ncbi:hypothetical protein [Burkholderia multivorans]|nr:hypothetical protein [Burkholderia multivorans]MDI3300039.1 hypothetical protein [Burkholderia multivorans]
MKSYVDLVVMLLIGMMLGYLIAIPATAHAVPVFEDTGLVCRSL